MEQYGIYILLLVMAVALLGLLFNNSKLKKKNRALNNKSSVLTNRNVGLNKKLDDMTKANQSLAKEKDDLALKLRNLGNSSQLQAKGVKMYRLDKGSYTLVKKFPSYRKAEAWSGIRRANISTSVKKGTELYHKDYGFVRFCAPDVNPNKK